MQVCEICGEEFEEGTMYYNDTCDECAKDEGVLTGYVIFKEDVRDDERTIFKKGINYEIIDEDEGNLYVESNLGVGIGTELPKDLEGQIFTVV